MSRVLSDAVPSASSAYVVTVATDGRAHVAPTTAVVAPGGAVVLDDLGRRTRANLAAGSAVTVVWSTGDPADYTVIVDGSGSLDDGRCTVRPERAVLHRGSPSEHDGGEGCTADCVELAVG